MRGKSVKVSTLEKMLNASYAKDRPDEIDGYQLDKELSVPTVAVYFSPSTRKAKVVIRGTEPTFSDWKNNLSYAVGNYVKTDRFRIAKEVTEKAEAKYGKENIDILAHSQAAIPARILGADNANIIELNPAYINEKHLANEHVIRSSRDPVSMLKMFSKAGNDIIIPAKSFNPLTEHSIDVLKRLPQDQVIGRGIHVKFRKRIRK